MIPMLTGRGVRVAIVDSGVNPTHPHVGRIAGGIAIDEHGGEHADYVDRLGHGTAVTAAIREKAPEAELFAVKVFDRALATNMASLIAGIDWAATAGMHLVNLSLGTSRQAHEQALREAVTRAAARGTLIVSAYDDGEARWLPGSLPGVIPVVVDYTLARDQFRVADLGGTTLFHASGFAREIPGVPPERNLHGISLAVANVTGFAARAAEVLPSCSFEAVVLALREGGLGPPKLPSEGGI
jgi:subtilisin family serine protease